MIRCGKNERGNEVVVNVASVCETDNGYRFGYDGFKVELTPFEAYLFYTGVKQALETSTDFSSVSVNIASEGKWFKIKRTHLNEINGFFKIEEKSGTAKWLK